MSQVVSEDLARKAVDRIVEAAVDSQRANGVPVPSAAPAIPFAQDVVQRVINEHEQGRHAPAPQIAPSLPPDRLSRGDVGPDTQVINRPYNPGQPRNKAPEDPRLRARLNFLGTMPDWEDKIIKAALEGETAAKRMGFHDWDNRMSVVADYVIAEVDKSNAIFGDWRLPPKPRDPRLIIT
jgi:hypothetical protein